MGSCWTAFSLLLDTLYIYWGRRCVEASQRLALALPKPIHSRPFRQRWCVALECFDSLEASPSGRFNAVLALARQRWLPTLKVASAHAIGVRRPVTMRLLSDPNPRAVLMYLLWHLALTWSSLYATSCVGPLGHSLQLPPTLRPLLSVFLSYLRCLATPIPKAVSMPVTSDVTFELNGRLDLSGEATTKPLCSLWAKPLL